MIILDCHFLSYYYRYNVIIVTNDLLSLRLKYEVPNSLK